MLGGIGMILAVVLVANGMGSEYSWNTIRPYLLCSESRLKMFTCEIDCRRDFHRGRDDNRSDYRNFAGRIIHGN